MRIFEYTPAFLHAKVAVVDDDWATVGSSNIDPLSLLLNLEANVVVRDPGFAAALAAALRRRLRGFGRSHCHAHAGGLARLAAARPWWPGRRALYLRVAGITGRY